MHRGIAFTAALAATALAAGCVDEASAPTDDVQPSFSVGTAPALDPAVGEAYLDGVNATLAQADAGYRVSKAEWLMAPNGRPQAASVVFATDRTLRLNTRWAPGDPRRLADGNNITYGTFLPLAIANGAGFVAGPIASSFGTWNAVACSKVPLVERTIPAGIFPSAILGISGFSNDPFAADIATIGFVPAGLVDAVLGPGASNSVLAVTFTFIFVSGGTPTDIDGDGRADTAHKEVWYNNGFLWTTGGTPGEDVETVALHENGHALELGHFGRIAVNLSAGKLQVSPRAVMNAISLGEQRTPLGTDNAAYCGNFASWPH